MMRSCQMRWGEVFHLHKFTCEELIFQSFLIKNKGWKVEESKRNVVVLGDVRPVAEDEKEDKNGIENGDQLIKQQQLQNGGH